MQTLSNSVADALLTLKEMGFEDFCDVDATVKFIKVRLFSNQTSPPVAARVQDILLFTYWYCLLNPAMYF